jgi:hypothetical protein
LSTRNRTTAARPAELGEITFDDWYETPVFDIEPDERLEHLATSKRAPVRLLGAALLRVAPDPGVEPEALVDFAPPPRTWRERTSRLLDRWAAVEAASQAKLEQRVLPKRWRS